MLNDTKNFFFALTAVASLFAMGCDDGGGTTTATGGSTSQNPTGGSGGGSGGTTTTPGAGIAVTPDATGWVDGTNEAGVLGAWYVYADSIGEEQTCVKVGMHALAECAVVTDPPATAVGFPNTGGKMCVKGTSAKVLLKTGATSATDWDYSNMWGAGIGLDLNHPAEMTKAPFDAVAKGITGISFKIDMATVSPLRVEFPIPATEGDGEGAAYWGATKDWKAAPIGNGQENIVKWDQVKQPGDPATAIPFDPSKILSIQFHVPSSEAKETPFDFCISELKFLK